MDILTKKQMSEEDIKLTILYKRWHNHSISEKVP